MSIYARLRHLASSLDAQKDSARFLERVLMSSRAGIPSPHVVQWLQSNCVSTSEYRVYRGVAPGKLSRQQIVDWRKLKVGDPVPEIFVGLNKDSSVVHCSLSEKVSNYYAKGGTYGVVFEMVVKPKYVLFDGRFFEKAFNKEDYGPEDFALGDT